MMAVHSSKPLMADGRWGSYTQSAYSTSPAEVKRAVDQILSSFGTTAVRLRTTTLADSVVNPNEKQEIAAQRAVLKGGNTAMRELVAKIAADEGVPVETALKICWLESKFDPNAKSGTGAKGLFQFTSIAVREVAERGNPAFNLKGREYDPTANATAGMRYIKIVAKTLGVPLTDASSVYMGFNIGPSAAKSYRAGNVTASIAKLINLQAYGPPAVYGKNLIAAIARAPGNIA